MKNLARPYVKLKVAISLDGYLDDTSPTPRVFSNEEDRLAVDLLRAESDAVLIGAQTIRKDNPRIIVRDEFLRASRSVAGLSIDPIKVTLTSTGNIPANCKFLTLGDSKKIIYSLERNRSALQGSLGGFAELVFFESQQCLDLALLLQDLAKRGIKTLLVEGGANLIDQFLMLGLADEMRVAISSEILGPSMGAGDGQAPRFLKSLSVAVGSNFGPATADRFSRKPILDSLQKLGDMAVLTYKFN